MKIAPVTNNSPTLCDVFIYVKKKVVALKGQLGEAFFEPLPEEELQLWE